MVKAASHSGGKGRLQFSIADIARLAKKGELAKGGVGSSDVMMPSVVLI